MLSCSVTVCICGGLRLFKLTRHRDSPEENNKQSNPKHDIKHAA